MEEAEKKSVKFGGTIRKTGNSFHITIPPWVIRRLDDHGKGKGDDVDVEIYWED